MSNYYIGENRLNEEQLAKLTMPEMVTATILRSKQSLYKYFPNTIKVVNGKSRNFSLEALKNNTVYLASPREFDDPYDCNVFVDSNNFSLQRVRYYAALCGVKLDNDWNYADISIHIAEKIYNHISTGNPVNSLFPLNTENELVSAHQELFLLMLENELRSPQASGESYYTAINRVITQEYNDMQQNANRFRIACFSQTPYSMLMWSHYANSHKGFCIEYEIPIYSENTETIFHNLYPVIYTDIRKDLSQLSINWNSLGNITDDELCDFYKYCLLSKSLDWKYQQEIRLISCDDLITDENYICQFFKIKKVYLGNQMQPDERKEIIKICKDKGIAYVGVTISQDRFEMRDCENLCENCLRLKNK